MSFARLTIKIAAGLLAIALIVFLLANARSIDPIGHNRIIANLSKLQELDSELDEIVLKVRDALINNYDPLVATLNLIKWHKRDLEQGEYAIAGRGELEIDKAMAGFSRKLAEKEALIEQFKSKNSLLKNSFHYFPLSVEVLSRDPQIPQAVRTRAQALLRDILLLRLGATPTDYELIAKAINQLHEGQQHPPSVRTRLGVVLQHAQNVLTHQQELDRLVQEITAADVRNVSKSLVEAYSRAFERELKQANLYRFILLLVSLALVTYAAHSFLRLRENAVELNKVLAAQASEIAERKRAEEQLRLAASALENAAEGVMISDEHRRIAFVNKAFTRITGYAPSEAVGKDPDFLRSGEHDAAFYEAVWSEIRNAGGWRGEMWRRRKDGEIYPEWRSVSPVKDEAGQTTHFVSVFTDISQLKQDKARLEFLAHHDALTHLPNRTLFEDRLQEALNRAQRHAGKVGLLFIDLDRFKNINDSLGHGVGDLLLQAVTSRLKECVRKTDTVARLGGDEFTVLLDELAEPQHAAKVAEKLLAALAQPFKLGGHDLVTSASIGISCYPDDGSDTQTLLKNADAAMYAAKESGRNTYRFFSAEMNASALEMLVMTSNLRVALERDEFFLNYQPIVDLASGNVSALEALLRWKHPELGMIPPVRFIPLAEDSGLIIPIGDWVLKQACAQMKAWQIRGIAPGRMAVNLSVRQFKQKELAQRIAAILNETGLAPQCLELEITESMVMQDPAEAEKVLDQLHEMGIQLAIDDFGTGYSSLSYLKRFPIDFLKIDRSFVQDIPGNPDDVAITRGIVALAKSLDLWVIAEGVETEQQHAFLKAEGCEEAQGYLWSKPRSAEELETLLRENARPLITAERRG